MTAAATLSSKYQVSIPKSVRERMAWRPGQKIAFIARADGILDGPDPGTGSAWPASREAQIRKVTVTATTATDARCRYVGLD